MTNGVPLAGSRRDFLRATGIIAAAAAIVGPLSACGGGDNPNKRTSGGPATQGGAANDQGTITAGISYELGTNGYDPMTTTAALTVAVNWHVMEGLTEIMPTGDRETYPALASALPQKVDDTTWRATLRDGATFHDGSKVTADDVVFSFERVLDKANKSLYASFIPFLDKVVKVDDKTVEFKLSYPFSLVPERLAVVKIVPKAAVTADAKGFDAKPVGTGPWKLTDGGAASKSIKFERFDGYTGPRKARAAKMEWKILADESTRTNALTSGSVQAIDSVPYLSIDAIKGRNKVESVTGFSLLFAMFNCGAAPFNDVRNRQGVLYAIDMEKVIKTAFLGNAVAATSFVHQEHPAYKRAKNVYAFDQAKAKQLFGETRLTKVRLLCTDHGWVKKATPIIKESLEAAGLQVEFTEKKSADVYNTIDGKPEAYDIVIAPGDPSVFGNDPDLLLRWWYAGDTWTDQRMHWKGQPSYVKVQELLDQASRATGDAQKTLWQDIFDLVSDEVPLYPLFHRKSPTAWDDKALVGFKPISLTGLSFIDVASTK
ncbi:ABC transporter substrate-binding protein [Mariniluteicoccus endophyticus]